MNLDQSNNNIFSMQSFGLTNLVGCIGIMVKKREERKQFTKTEFIKEWFGSERVGICN